MKKHILSIIFLSFMVMAAPVCASAMSAIDLVELAPIEANIGYRNHTLSINNAAGEVLYIYDVTGTLVMTVRITSDSQKVELGDLKRGCYIVKVGKTVRKISVS